MNEKRNYTTVAFTAAILTLLGLFILSYNYIEKEKIEAFDYMSSKYSDTSIQTKKVKQSNTPQEENKVEISNDYIGYLIIPKINLTKGFTDSRSTENDVEKNIMVIDGSNYPDVDKGNFILAGHSGTGWKAFFNDLNKLVVGDIAKVTYNGKTYTYQITNIYTQPKTGRIAIYRNYDKTTLTLITCTNNDSTTQTVYIAELTNKE